MNPHSLRQRRRRVTLDQNQSSTAVPPPRPVAADDGEGKSVEARPYTQGALRSRQLKTTDLIPKRWWAVAALGVGLAVVMVMLNLMHHYAPGMVATIGEQGIAALSLESQRGIGAWYCNFMLILTSCASLQLFLLRQHRRDDYRGAYRIWLWVAGLCLLASVLSVSSLTSLMGNVWSGTTGLAGGSIWIVILKLSALALLTFRGLIEVRHSRLALTGLILVFAAYALAALIREVPEFQSTAEGYVQAAEGNLLVVGSSLLLFSVISYARFVYLQANGLAVPAGNRSRQQSSAKSDRKSGSTRRSAAKSANTAATKQRKAKADESVVDSPVAEKSKRSQKSQEEPSGKKKNTRSNRKASSSREASTSDDSVRRKKKAATDSVEDSGKPARKKKKQSSAGNSLVADHESDSTLSKSERRRMRKLKRREQRRAA